MRRASNSTILNAITPETENTTWYFYAHSRNFAQDDPNMDEEFSRELRGAFQEDVDILAAQQMNMDRHAHNPKEWIDIKVDGPGQRFGVWWRMLLPRSLDG